MSDRATSAASGLTATNALRTGPGRPRRVTEAAVIDAALRVMQAEGLAAVTMRRVADEVEAGIATVYAALGNKEDILVAAVKRVLEDIPDVSPDLAPREALMTLWTGLCDLLIAHPAVAQLGALQPVGGDGTKRLVERTLSLLRAAGLSDQAAWDGCLTLRSYTAGYTLIKISRPATESDGSPSSTGGHDLEFAAGLGVLFDGLLPQA